MSLVKREWNAPGPGSNDHARRVLLEIGDKLGLSRGEAHELAGTGAFGEAYPCILTYGQIARTMVNAQGKPYHRESAGRIMRSLAARGLIIHKRLGPGRPTSHVMPDGKRWSFASGTTENLPNWDLLTRLTGIPRPHYRGVRMRARRQHALETRRSFNAPPPGLVEHMQRTGRDETKVETPGAERSRARRYAAAAAPSREQAAPPLDPELAATIEAARSACELRDDARDVARTVAVVNALTPSTRGPP